ncbi:MAG: dynamin family protein [Microthrixaceae bacterium]
MADQQTMGAVDAPDIRIDVLKSVQRAGGVLSASGLTDALDRMADHARRVLTPGVVIAVVGAPGSGKSALVNGLIGSPLLMVDERFSTVVPTLVRDTRSPELAIRGRSDGRVETRAVPTEGMPSITTSLGNSGNRLDLFRVEVGTPNPILATGFTFIDMPAETLPARGSSRAAALAPLVDALIVAVPADRSITTAELGLVRRARDRGAHVVVAVTKLDSVGGKELRVEAVRSTLAADGLDVAVLGTSYSWRVLAMSRPGDPSIDAASGFPALIDHLDRSVRWRAQLVAASRSVAEGRSGVAQAQLLRAASAAAVRDPDVAEALGRGAGTLAELGRADTRTGSDPSAIGSPPSLSKRSARCMRRSTGWQR